MRTSTTAETIELEQDLGRPPQLGAPTIGHPNSFEVMVLKDESVRRRLFATALKFTRANTADAEDLVQNTYLRAYRKWHKFDGRKVCAWMTVIMRNLFLNDYSSRARDPLATAQNDEVLATVSVDPNEEISTVTEAKSLLGDDLWGLLYGPNSSIPQQSADMFLDVYVFEMSYSDAAKKYMIPIGTVMSRLFRVSSKLKNNQIIFDRARNLGIIKKDPEVVAGETQCAATCVLQSEM